MIVVIVIIVKEDTLNRLKKARLQQGLRQLDLAKKADISISWLWALENSFSLRVSRTIKERVARALGCPYEKLFPEG